MDIIINKFWSYPSIVKLKRKLSFKRKFAFKPVTEEFVKNIAKNVSRNEAAGEDIQLNLLKESTFVLPCIVHCVSETLVKSEFFDPLNLSNIVPVHKKEDPTNKTKYKPVSVLPLQTAL